MQFLARRLFFFCTLTVAFAPALRAQSHKQAAPPDSAAVVEAVERFREALVAGDSTAAAALLAPEALILESGSQETKAEYLGHHFHADHTFLSAMTRAPLSHSARVEGDAAWAASTSRLQGRYEGREIDLNSAELMVLGRTSAGWKISAIHWSSRSRQ